MLTATAKPKRAPKNNGKLQAMREDAMAGPPTKNNVKRLWIEL